VLAVIKSRTDQVKGYDVKEAYESDAKGVTIRWISEKRTGSDEFLHNFALRHFTIKPKGYLAPHKHPWEQEIIVTKGRAQVISGSEKAVANQGDVFYFAANELHGFQNESNSDFEFYCVIGCIGKGENCIGLQG
jgi:quercetin dioxygenase-like cupin family protein